MICVCASACTSVSSALMCASAGARRCCAPRAFPAGRLPGGLTTRRTASKSACRKLAIARAPVAQERHMHYKANSSQLTAHILPTYLGMCQQRSGMAFLAYACRMQLQNFPPVCWENSSSVSGESIHFPYHAAVSGPFPVS